MRVVVVQPSLAIDAHNGERMRVLLAPERGRLGAGDLVLLPEHWSRDTDGATYQRSVVELARELGCHVVGGSHHELQGDRTVHRGVAVAPDGTVLGRYEKLRPYAYERRLVTPGELLGELEIAGRPMLVLICADFWFSDLVLATRRAPDVILVPALSVSRKPTPDYSRALWRHLAVSRAYELGAWVAISDWAHASQLPALSSSGVAGFADPTSEDAGALFRAAPDVGLLAQDIDFDRLEAFRVDRRGRGFFWR